MPSRAASWLLGAFLVVLTLLGAHYATQYHMLSPSVHYDPLHPSAGFGQLYGRKAQAENISFLATGDWGIPTRMQRVVATQMGEHAQRVQAQFVASNGDNIYSWGVGSVHDPRFELVFDQIFAVDSTFRQMPWYMALGNHDRRGNIAAQVEYSAYNPRWVLPSNYYDVYLPAFDHLHAPPVHLIVLDTLPMICADMDFSTAKEAMDFVECEAFLYSDMARELVKKNGGVHSEQVAQEIHQALSLERREQFRWLEGVLENNPHERAITIVVGHHAMESASLVHGKQPLLEKDLLPLLEKYGVQLYMAGHDHNLQHIHHSGSTLHHLVVGGGGYVTSINALHPVYSPQEYRGLLFGAATYGFATISVSPTSLAVEFVDYLGDIIYSTKINI